MYQVEVRDGIDGKIVVSVDLDQAYPGTVNNFTTVQGNTWVINGDVTVDHGSRGLLLLNGSIGSSTTATFNDDVMTNLTQTGIDLVFISLGHNETDDVYVDTLEAFIDDVKLYCPDAKIVLVTQNSQTTPRTVTQILEQDNRMDQVKLVAARNDLAIVDAYSVLNTDTVTFVSADGVHPTTEGSIVWADAVSDFLNQRTDEGASSMTLLVEDGELIIEPDVPTKDGYTFDGWYTNAALTNEWDFSNDLVQEDMILNAKWIGTTSSSWTLSAPGETLALFGIAWYWYVAIAGGAYFLFGTKKGKKALKKIGLK